MTYTRVIVAALASAYLAWGPSIVLGQSATAPQPGEKVYKRVADAVLLLEAVDSTGAVTGTGTGFLVAPSEVITNAHVSDAGELRVRLGAVRLGCAVRRVDHARDLALCVMAGKSAASPLTTAAEAPKPGATIFAVGNPRGLENTISQGLFTGYRELDGRKLAQISAAISPGSSGGPIVNVDGDVVGVAVMMLTNGQNLNFAVPLDDLKSFLAGHLEPTNVSGLLAEARQLQESRDSLKLVDSKWSELDGELVKALNALIDGSGANEILDQAYEVAGIWHVDLQVRAAEKSVATSKTPSREQYARLGRALYYSTDDTPQGIAYRERAEAAASKAVALGGGKNADDLQLLGDVQLEAQRWQAAYDTYKRASVVASNHSMQFTAAAFALFQASQELKRFQEADTWFQAAKLSGGLNSWQWLKYAAFEDLQKNPKVAGDAALEAARLAPSSYRAICDAGGYFYSAGEIDQMLSANRSCIERAASATGADADLEWAHRANAAVLEARGIYDEAVVQAKQAIAIDVSDAFAHEVLARAYTAMRRYNEALTEVKAALRLSDGKYSSMQFLAGSIYFNLEQWPEAIQAYRLAAQQDPKDGNAAFNVAAAAYNNREYPVALDWYRETLRRNPNHPRKDEINKTIQQLMAR